MEMLEMLLPPEATMQLADPSMVNYYQCLDNRILWVDGEIDITLLEITRLIMYWNIQDKGIPVEERKPIKLFIFSPGGNLAETMHACSIMQMSKTPVWTVNMGMAMSGGFLLLINGHKRFTMPYARAMFHRGSGGAAGTYGQAEDAMKDYNAQMNDMQNLVLERTKISKQAFGKKKDRDWYFGAEEQVKNGVVDEIVTDLEQII